MTVCVLIFTNLIGGNVIEAAGSVKWSELECSVLRTSPSMLSVGIVTTAVV